AAARQPAATGTRLEGGARVDPVGLGGGALRGHAVFLGLFDESLGDRVDAADARRRFARLAGHVPADDRPEVPVRDFDALAIGVERDRAAQDVDADDLAFAGRSAAALTH